MVIETVCGKYETAITAEEADQFVAEYENDPWSIVRRYWDGVAFVVTVTADGPSRRGRVALPFVSYMVPLIDS